MQYLINSFDFMKINVLNSNLGNKVSKGSTNVDNVGWSSGSYPYMTVGGERKRLALDSDLAKLGVTCSGAIQNQTSQVSSGHYYTDMANGTFYTVSHGLGRIPNVLIMDSNINTSTNMAQSHAVINCHSKLGYFTLIDNVGAHSGLALSDICSWLNLGTGIVKMFVREITDTSFTVYIENTVPNALPDIWCYFMLF